MSSPPPPTNEALLKTAADETTPPSEAISILYKIVQDRSTPENWQSTKRKAIIKLSILLTQEGRAGEIPDLIIKARHFFYASPCAQSVKVSRSIIDAVSKLPRPHFPPIAFHQIPFNLQRSALQMALYRQILKWARAQNRTHLRHKMEDGLAELMIERRRFSEAFDLLSGLAQESRTSNDRLRLIEICLLGAKLHLSRQDLPKAKAALAEAKETAAAILKHMPPYDRAMLAMQIGIFHVEERDYISPDMYFEFACSAFDDLADPMLSQSLRYWVLCKIMWGRADDVASMDWPEVTDLYESQEFDGMRAVADARAKRSFKLFVTALKDYEDELREDPIVSKHLDLLRDALLKDNLRRLIGPGSRVGIADFAELFELPADKVEQILSGMIVDRKLAGSLDEVPGYLIIYDGLEIDDDIISEMGKVFVNTRRE